MENRQSLDGITPKNEGSRRDDLTEVDVASSDDLSQSVLERLLGAPVVSGTAAAGIFYLGLLNVVLPLVPSYRASLETLFCGHPLAYGTTILFWIGMAAVGGKWWQ